MKTWQTWIWILAVAVVLGYALFVARSGAWTTHQVAGMAILIPGFCMWAVARLQLGRSFAITAQAKELVTHGLYSKIQNPVYVFGWIGIAGLVVFFWRPEWLLLLVILIPVQLARIKKERAVLEEKFGEAYREYRRKTWF